MIYMLSTLENNSISETEIIIAQYHTLKDSIKDLQETKDLETSMFLKILELRLASLLTTIEKITDTRMNATLQKELSLWVEENLEVIRHTLIKIDTEWLTKAKVYFDKYILKNSL